MEDYVIIDSVLQAIHMSKFKKRPKHLKKYEMNSSRSYGQTKNYTICYQPYQPTFDKGRLSMRPPMSFIKMDNFIDSSPEKNKLKMRLILEQSEKIVPEDKIESGPNCFSQFFVKKQIKPKSSRQHSSRNVILLKNQEVTPQFFYDVNTQPIKKKSRKCLILPESKKKNFQAKQNELRTDKVVPINVKQFVKQQWQTQKLRRKAQCKTSSCLMRHKTLLQKQAKKIQDQLKNKQNEENYIRTKGQQKYSHKLYLCQPLNKIVLPLSKEEIRTKATALMGKYGIDSSRCCLKVIGN